RIKGDFGADTNPEPLQMCGDSPARLIEPIHQTVTDGNLNFLIRGFGFLCQSRHRAAKRAAADSEAVAPFQDLSGTLVRDPHLFDQMRGQSESLRPDLHVRCSQSIRRLQRVPPLNVFAATGAMARFHIEPAHNRLPDDVFLKLRQRAVVNDSPAAVGTLLRQWNRNLFIHAIRNSAESSLSVIRATLASGPLRIVFAFAFRE